MIYRSTPYLLTSSASSFFDFLVNVFGFAMPFPVCLHEDLPVVVVALLGYVPPLLATVTAIAYAVWYVGGGGIEGEREGGREGEDSNLDR